MLVELPSRDLLSEHDIEFLKSAVLGLGETEPCPDGSKEAESSPEEGCLAGPVPCGRVHHVRLEDTANDISNIVRASAEDDGLGANLCGADFGDNSVDDWPCSHGIRAQPDQAESGLDVFDSCSLVNAGEDADEVEAEYEDAETGKEDRASPKAADQEPREDCAAERNAGATEADAVGSISVDAGLLEEAIQVRIHGLEMCPRNTH